MQCYRHPRVETNVSCGKCDRPICPRCMVAGPAGMRCPDCSSLRKTTLYQIPPHRIAFAAIAGLITGIVGAFLMTIGWFVFFLGPIYGGIVAEAVLRAAGRKRGRVLEVIGVGSIVLGALVVCLPALLLLIHPPAAAPNADGPPSGLFLGWGLTGLLWPLVGCGLAISTCYARLKYW